MKPSFSVNVPLKFQKFLFFSLLIELRTVELSHRLSQGFIYLVAVMDWFSRYVLSWELSVTMDMGFFVEASKAALRRGTPGIFNTDRGAQFTSDEFTGTVLSSGAKVSRDGRGRVFDNSFVERLWRSVKYEEVFLHDYTGVPEAREGLGHYFQFYNEERRIPPRSSGRRRPVLGLKAC